MADQEKQVKLVHPNGALVSVRESKAERLLASGFTKPTAAKKST